MPRRNHQPSPRIVAAPRVLRQWKPSPDELAGDVAALGPFENAPKKERKRRSAQEQKTNPYESRIQASIVTELRRTLALGYRVKANVECVDPVERGHAIRKGWEPHWPDLEVWGFGRCWLLECKDRDGDASTEQLKRHDELRGMGFMVLSECRSVHQAIAWLMKSGVVFRIAA
jgi:hypothetical protein